MTDYNKRTYRVDDVTWTETPLSTFKMKEETVSYMDYYYKVRLIFILHFIFSYYNCDFCYHIYII